MFKQLKSFFKKEQFQPSIFAIFINPFYFARRGLFQAIRKDAKYISGKTLDIGCGQKPYKSLYASQEYLGLEIDTPDNRLKKQADFFYDGLQMPFDDGFFDSIVCNEVFEHVFNPQTFLQEINRVLRGGGYMLISMPFVWDEHEQPFDYARYSSFGIKHLLEENGFEIIHHQKTNNGIEVVFQLINAYIYKKLCTKNKIVRLITITTFCSIFNILGIFFSTILPRNNDLYLDNVILARKR